MRTHAHVVIVGGGVMGTTYSAVTRRKAGRNVPWPKRAAFASVSARSGPHYAPHFNSQPCPRHELRMSYLTGR